MSAQPADLAQLGRVRFVLIETSLSANMGAVARAMKTMGLMQLCLVRPRQALDAEALARAAGADDLLARARVCASLEEALTGCRLVIGSSARARSLAWPEVDPAGCAERLLENAAEAEVALLLGRERSGLTNDELSHCHFLTRIPANPDYSSLNIAAAAQVFAYELRRVALRGQLGAARAGEPAPASGPFSAGAPRSDLATADEMASFYGHLEQTMTRIGFADPDQSSTLRRRLRRLFNRARPDRTELNILRGILSAAEGRKHPDRFRR
ncbi:tRNA (cytosine(32)/uridine(32)-2'-O)-methyltransferase TrmJ [Halochromatium salexigens]|uniref:tRNA (cytidine/uridine-2'-O-)-methyltransferase TrmJ n=2 Tax=Halochromatium salexigens TaxID=49447 RepID=A0AAJ0UGJ8_HALSE|nr:tRNA (cytosine(32)/uridine(32)-2'-O)-methyltransferase TrmJ [Halochromatium salexigens]